MCLEFLTTKSIDMETRLSSKDLMLDITSMQRFAEQLLGKGKDYEDLLQFLLAKDYYNDENISLPPLKELQVELGIPYPILRKQLSSIYQDIMNYEENGLDFSINEVEYILSIHYFENYVSFKLNHLPVMPRVGEQMHIPFFRAGIGMSSFYVSSINHYLDDKKQSIHLTLQVGTYNQAWHFRKDEAYLKGQISLKEYYSNNDYELAEKLGFVRS